MPRLKPDVLAQRKEHILRAALTCFAHKGYHETSMNEIVAEAGLSKGGIYVHFDSKQTLFQEVLRWSVGQFGVTTDPFTLGDNAYEQLQQFIDSMMTMVDSESFRETVPLTLEMWALNANDPAVKETASELYDSYRQPLTRLIQAGIADGLFRPVDATSVANILIAVPEGLMVQAMIDDQAVDWQTVTATLHVMVDGLLDREEINAPSRT